MPLFRYIRDSVKSLQTGPSIDSRRVAVDEEDISAQQGQEEQKTRISSSYEDEERPRYPSQKEKKGTGKTNRLG